MKNIKEKPIYNFILSALFCGIIIVCSWITFPTAVPFTMQIFAVFLVALVLPLKYSLISLAGYVLLGIAGLPVFSGFQGGIGVIAGQNGGYVLGFFIIALVVGIGKKFCGDNKLGLTIAMLVGLFLCYALGAIWFSFVVKTSFVNSVVICVLPYVVFDVAKGILAVFTMEKLKKVM